MSLVTLIVFLLISSAASLWEPIQLVSIIDSSSTLSCLLKIHTIISSSKNVRTLFFRFLIVNKPSSNKMDTNESEILTISGWNANFIKTFPNIQYETKLWVRPNALRYITGVIMPQRLLFVSSSLFAFHHALSFSSH